MGKIFLTQRIFSPILLEIMIKIEHAFTFLVVTGFCIFMLNLLEIFVTFLNKQ